MPLTVSIKESVPEVFVVSAAGILDGDTSAILEDRLDALKKRSPQSIVLDLRDLTFLSSAGVRVILATTRWMKERGGKLVVANPQPAIKKVFQIIQALPAEAIFESVEELDQYLSYMQQKVRKETDSQ